MGEIVNLNRFRKQRERDEKAASAATNRAKHGRTKEEKILEEAEADRREKDLDNKHID